MSRRGPKRKDGVRYPGGKLVNPEPKEERVAPTTELLLQRVAVLTGMPTHEVVKMPPAELAVKMALVDAAGRWSGE